MKVRVDGTSLLERARAANAGARHRRAVTLCNAALNGKVDVETELSLRLERATGHVGGSNFELAEVDCRRVLARGESARAQALVARCLLERDRLDEAIEAAEKAVAIEHAPAESWRVLARALSKKREHDAAVLAALEARRREPRESALTLILVLASAGRDEEVIAVTRDELEVGAPSAALWTALGQSLNARGRSEEAVQAFRSALTLEPGHLDAHCGLGQALLRLGHFSDGYVHHEHRQRRAGAGRRYGIKAWRGEPLDDKHLIVWAEQGFGDTLQFVRFLPHVRRLTQKTTLYVALPLLRLFRSTPALGPVESHFPGFAASDYQILSMSVPHVLGLGDDLGTDQLPLFQAEPERVAYWRARLPAGPKIALAWQGNPKYGGEPWRSMPFVELEPLLARFAGRATFVSLQKNFGSEQVAKAPFRHGVLDLSRELDASGDAFVDSLAVLSLSDLFITTDSSLAHLAGSAGARAWVLLSEVADWRWGVSGDRTPWYPELRLFRQTVGADWAGVVARVTRELEQAPWLQPGAS
jgi:tetratricopeptide (TPR) repeat protein